MERRVGLARKSKLKRTGRLGRVSKKHQVKLDAWPAIRDAALERAGYRCEYVEDFDGYPAPCERTTGLHVHHRLRRSQGGSDSDANLVVLCSFCHAFVHDYPSFAYLGGWMIHANQWEARALR